LERLAAQFAKLEIPIFGLIASRQQSSNNTIFSEKTFKKDWF